MNTYTDLRVYPTYLKYFGRNILLDVEAGVERHGDPALPQVLPLLTQLTLHPLQKVFFMFALSLNFIIESYNLILTIYKVPSYNHVSFYI